jgi:hypothetical protein
VKTMSFVVFRNSREERTVAVVTAQVTPPLRLRGSAGFLKALKSALTAWVRETDEGRRAWKNSSEDFNVGDLSTFMVWRTNTKKGEPWYEMPRTLTPYLKDVGILQLQVETYCDTDVAANWDYDTVLVNAEEVKEIRCEKDR